MAAADKQITRTLGGSNWGGRGAAGCRLESCLAEEGRQLSVDYRRVLAAHLRVKPAHLQANHSQPEQPRNRRQRERRHSH